MPAAHNYVVYGRAGCPWCEKAVDLLCRLRVPMTYKQFGVDYSRSDLEALVPGVKTVPQIFEDGKLIGGYSELSLKFGGNGRDD